MARRQSKVVVSREKARRFFLAKQLLTHSKIPERKPGALRVIEKLGYVQIDTINVVERSHHLVLHSRVSEYKQEYLHALQAKDKRIFEYWAHAASFIPMKDYRFYLPVIRRKPKPGSWFDKWTKKHPRLIKDVRKRIQKEGPLTPSDFGDVENRKRGPWWDWKPAKAALEVLFWRGELMIKERRNFQRVYDLTQRVLPNNLDTTLPAEEEEKQFFIRRALGAMGVATIQEINRYIGISGRLNEWLIVMQETGQITEVEVQGIKRPYYVLNQDIPGLLRRRSTINENVYLLSPFDNSIILRDRTEALFDFKYSLECYVPKNNRKYGYFCLPILWHDQLVGRFDPKADRQRMVLLVNSIYLEQEIDAYSAFLIALAKALNNFAAFNACEHIELNKRIPAKIARNLSSYLV
ncbi:MAG: crosslink repair DNA glycosylase YcaQ family protein [bacterium]